MKGQKKQTEEKGTKIILPHKRERVSEENWRARSHQEIEHGHEIPENEISEEGAENMKQSESN